MKVETTIVTVGETPKDKCPTYEKRTAETFAEMFSLIPNFVPTPAQTKAIADLDAVFPMAKLKDKDGKETEVPNPFREDVLGHHNYGKDLWMKAKTRRDFEKTLEDPSKPVVNGIKGMMLSGFSAQEAYDLIKLQRDSKSLETPTFETVSAKLK